MKQEPNTPERIERIKEVYVDGDEKLVLPFSFAVLLDNMRCSINFLLDGWRRHCEECYTSPDSFSDKICIDAQCSCHTPTSPVGEKRCGDCEWLKKNLQPRNDVYEKCANGHTFPKHTPTSHADGKKCGCACHKRKEPSPNLAGWGVAKIELTTPLGQVGTLIGFNDGENAHLMLLEATPDKLQGLGKILGMYHSYVSSLLSLHTKKLRERIEVMKKDKDGKAEMMYADGRTVDLKLHSDMAVGYNQALSDVLSVIEEV